MAPVETNGREEPGQVKSCSGWRGRRAVMKRAETSSWCISAVTSVQQVDGNNCVDDQRSKWQQQREGRPMGPNVYPDPSCGGAARVDDVAV